MSDEEAFLQAILNSPKATLMRLVFADWLEEQGDPRAELLRLLHVLTQSIKVPRRELMENRLRQLLEMGVKPVGPFITNSIGMKFALIPPGTFMMGSPPNEEGRQVNETQHEVELDRAYFLGIHPVTQAQWREFMGNTRTNRRGDDLPAAFVSWDDCQMFMQKLSEHDGQIYRFPTEVEWEYACRAGTTTPFYFGRHINDRQASFYRAEPDQSDLSFGELRDAMMKDKSTSVGQFAPNGWGLYDMHGNVFEWCAEEYKVTPEGEFIDCAGPTGSGMRVIRGGSFASPPFTARSAYRGLYGQGFSMWFHGLRVAMSLKS